MEDTNAFKFLQEKKDLTAIDALIHGEVVVYTAPPPGAQPVFTVAPFVARGRSGVRVAIAF